jgi:hypothetical protein
MFRRLRARLSAHTVPSTLPAGVSTPPARRRPRRTVRLSRRACRGALWTVVVLV